MKNIRVGVTETAASMPITVAPTEIRMAAREPKRWSTQPPASPLGPPDRKLSLPDCAIEQMRVREMGRRVVPCREPGYREGSGDGDDAHDNRRCRKRTSPPHGVVSNSSLSPTPAGRLSSAADPGSARAPARACRSPASAAPRSARVFQWRGSRAARRPGC